MTKTEAIQAMKEGKKVTHRLFTNNEYVYIKNRELFDETDARLNSFVFWNDRKKIDWETGWNIFEKIDTTSLTGEKVFTEKEVQEIIQQIYSEFAELPIHQHTTYSLRSIIKEEVEQHPLKPIQIFKK